MQRFFTIDCHANATQLMIDPFKLVKDCLKGKREAQKQLYEHFAGEMLAVCYRYTKSGADAEDVLQDPSRHPGVTRPLTPDNPPAACARYRCRWC